MYDVIIVGSGIAGSVMAREMAQKDKNVLIIEKRSHIGGNCYDTKDAHGVRIHPYGPHIYHTGNERVHEYLSQYTKWREFRHEVAAYVHGTYLPVPFNLYTLEKVFDQLTAKRIKGKLLERYGWNAKVPILELMNQTDKDLCAVGQYVYDNIYVGYTMKQWGKKPEEIDPAVTARVPVNISYDNGYFSDKYQGVPLDGYTAMFQHLLNHKNIEIVLHTEAKDVLQVAQGSIYFQDVLFEGTVIFTGPLDEFFGCKYGRLPYRTLNFAFEYYKRSNYQGRPVVNYTVDQEYTRITEYKFLTGQSCEGTTISKEYPYPYTGESGQIPYYAIANPENNQLFEQYKREVAATPNFHLLGRLAEYQYYNMDTMVEKALALAEKI